MSFPVPSPAQLIQQESEADTFYNFPAGTMNALGNSETSNGLNLGSIGNVFQVLPSTAANPGYGLSSVDGNNPMSVGAYLSALINGPGGGSVANGLALYQGRPVGSTGNNAMNQFLSWLGGGASALTGGSTTSSGSSSQAGGSIWTDTALRLLVGVLALVLIGLGLAALALKSDPGQVAAGVAKKAATAAVL